MRKRAGVVVYYVIPGGGVEENETYEEAAHREMLESIRQNKENLYIPIWVKIEDMKNMNIFPGELIEEMQKLNLNKM